MRFLTMTTEYMVIKGHKKTAGEKANLEEKTWIGLSPDCPLSTWKYSVDIKTI